MKNCDRFALVLVACAAFLFGGCVSTDDATYATDAAAPKTRESVPGEVKPNAPDASQQVRTTPGFNF